MALPAPQTTHVSEINIECFARALKNVYADCFVVDQFSVGAFADVSKHEDVSLSITSFFKEPPEAEILIELI